MSTFSEKDIERLLTMRPAPLPPARLAAQIKDEIPERIEVGVVDEEQSKAFPAHRQWRMLAVAASVMVVVSLGVLRAWIVPAVAEPGDRRAGLLDDGARAAARIQVASHAEPTPAETEAMRLVAIEVRVLGPDEAPRAGARVALERVGEDGWVAVTTDGQGWAQATGLLPGTWRLRCAVDARAAASDEVTLRPGQEASLLLLLHKGLEAWTPVA